MRRAWSEHRLNVLSAATAVLTVCLLCAFNVMDRDFWWHVTAGRLMWETGGLLRTDIFAYTRAGLPYVSTHEWLAQLVLAGVWYAGGATAVIVFRTFMVLVTLGVLLGKKGLEHLFVTAPLLILAAATGLPAFLERPQLFTFVCLAVVLRLAVAWHDESDGTRRRRLAAWWALVTVVWVNVHGGAALLSLAVFGVTAVSVLWRERAAAFAYFREAASIVCVLLLALLVSPDGWGNVSYTMALLSDRTTMFIHEWLPREASLYWADHWAWWLLVGTALWRSEKRRVFFGLLFALFACLSLQALRHEVLFVFVSLFIVIASVNDASEAWRRRRHAHPRRFMLAGLALLLCSVWWAEAAYVRLCQRDHLFGYGTFAPARGAFEYLEANDVRGPMFNTYGVGGYLLHRGYPDRPVYIDGRNVDYGFAFLAMTNVAGKDPAAFAELDRRYDFSYAVVDYDAAKEADLVSYSVHLDKNPDWALTYIDDLAAVYLKRTPENAALIARDAYRVLSPSVLDIRANRAALSPADLPVLEQELRRAVSHDAAGVKLLNVLSEILIGKGECAEASPLLHEAHRRQSRRPEPLVLLAACAAGAEDWRSAARIFDRALPLMGGAYPDANYAYIADVYAKAGRPLQAYVTLLRAGEWRFSVQPSQMQPPHTNGDALMANPAADAAAAFERGLASAEAGRMPEAEAAFLEAVMLNPSHAPAWNNLGAVRIREKRYAEAKEAIARALEQDAAFADAELNMAVVLYYLNDAIAAKTHLSRAADLGADVSQLRPLLP